MKTIRQIHFYLGCAFAPLLIYFSVTGCWQAFRFNDLPKDEPASVARTMLHEISKPHTNATLPGLNPKAESSVAFKILTVILGIGLIALSVLGILLAVRFGKSRSLVYASLAGGIMLPILFLLVH